LGSAGAPTKLKITPAEVDMPEVLVWESVTTDVTVENPLEQPVVIKNVHANCGCLDVKMPVTTIAPGKSEVITAKYTGQFGIPFKTVSVLFNTDEENSPEVKIKYHLKTKQDFTVTPSVLQFGRVKKGEPKALDVLIKSVDGKPFKIQEVRGPGKEFSCTWAAVEGANESAWQATVTVTGIKGGQLSYTGSFVTDRPERAIVPVNFAAEVVPDVVLTPDTLAAVIGSDDLAAPFETLVKRTSPGKLEIQKVTESRRLAVDYTVKQVDDSSAQLVICLKEPFGQRMPLGVFLIQTNAEENPLRLAYKLTRGTSAPAAPQPSGGEKKPPEVAH
jgi:hypothetical protein